MLTLRLSNVHVCKHWWMCNVTPNEHIAINVKYYRANSNDHITQHIALRISSTNENIDSRIESDGVFIGGKY